MAKTKFFIYLFALVFSQNIFAQVDTVTFRFEPDVATFKIRCIAQKIIGIDTTDFDFIETPADTNYTFTWGGDGTLLNNGVPNVTYSFIAAGNYTFTLDVEYKPTGKLYEETKTFDVQDIISVPNVFTPNGDGVNDYFIVRSNGLVTNPLEISIFSRTGTLVFSEKAPVIVWDGRNASGSKLSEGIYYYTLKTGRPNFPDQSGFLYLYLNE